MADLPVRDLALDCLLERIDRVVHHHEQLLQWNEPDSDGPIYPQQVERHRMARCEVMPQVPVTRITDTPVPPGPGVDTSALNDGGALHALIAELSVPLPLDAEGFFQPTGGEPDEQDLWRVWQANDPPKAAAPPRPSWWQRFARWPNVRSWWRRTHG